MRSTLALICLALFAQSTQAAGRLAEVLVIDRNSGTPLRTYYHGGEYWVAGTPGARYAIEIRNTLHERLLAVTSVDGINVLTGDTARWDQGGYVLEREQSCEITGWRKSQAEVAVFEFAAAPNSYAARTGRSANIGVIGVAVFRERRPAQVASTPPSVAAPAPEPRKPLRRSARPRRTRRNARALHRNRRHWQSWGPRMAQVSSQPSSSRTSSARVLNRTKSYGFVMTAGRICWRSVSFRVASRPGAARTHSRAPHWCTSFRTLRTCNREQPTPERA